ncbi:MAG TPA: flagellar motor protein [Candidatus Acidoferrum sp.]|nr:flagellar motor protein [Candidatus Acidoferrum sp.]
MDKSTFIGILLAVCAILLGLFLEGGKMAQILQPTAAMIVFGGTFGAVMIQFPLRVVAAALRRMRNVFFDQTKNPQVLIEEIVGYANKARKEGIVSLDSDLANIQDPFLKKTLMLAVDGTEPQEIRKMMELELENQAEHDENIPRVFESAGGFAPTIGIIGAVLGLIQVMQHLDDISEVGRGIAVAFVATIYGVASANLFFLPVGGKIKLRMQQEQTVRAMMLEGVISILEGMNPRMIETKLMAFFSEANQHANDRITS